MEQPEDEVARQEAWERYAEKLFSTESPLLPRLSALGMQLEDLRDTFEEMCENEDVLPAVPPETPPPDFTAARRPRSRTSSAAPEEAFPRSRRPAAGPTTRRPSAARCGSRRSCQPTSRRRSSR